MAVYSIVIPAHNEAARLGGTLDAYAVDFSNAELIVVLNGCTDQTAVVAADAGARHPNVRVVDLGGVVGKGAAVLAGCLNASGGIIGFADADGSVSSLELRRVFEAVSHADAAIGSRWLPQSRVEVAQPIVRRFASRAFNALVRVLFGLPFADTQCGAKAFTARSLRAVVADVETGDWAFDVDVLFALHRAGARIVEVPIAWRDTTGSRVRLIPGAVKMFMSVVRLRARHSVVRAAVPFFDRFSGIRPIRSSDLERIVIRAEAKAAHPPS